MNDKTYKFSFSAISDYETCPMLYNHKRVLKTPNPIIPSPLFFGTALDEAFSRLLLEKKLNLNPEEEQILKIPAEDIFIDYLTNMRDWNGNRTFLPTNPFCDYFFSDFDGELLTKEDLEHINKTHLVDSPIEFMNFLQNEVRDKKSLTEEDIIFYNEMNWLSLKNKGLLLVDAYRKQVLPEIYEVFDIQKHISLNNSSKDKFNGKIDFTCSFKEAPTLKYIADNKTSSKAYSSDSVQQSDQLISYSEAENIPNCAFVVIEKKLRKKEPKVRVTIIKDKIKEESIEKTFDKIDKFVDNITSGVFPKKEHKKECYSYGKICPFYKQCWGI